MSKLRPKEKSSAPKKISWGPCFIIVDDDNPMDAKPWCIVSDHEPSTGEVRATAEKVVRLHVASLKGRYRWELYHETPIPEDATRGKDALRLAKANILAGLDGPGKRFLQGAGAIKTRLEVAAKGTDVPFIKKRFRTQAEEFRAMETMPLPKREKD